MTGEMQAREGDAEAGGCLTFVRRVTPERVIEGFGMEPGSARLVQAGLVEAALACPVYAGGAIGGDPRPGRRSSQAANWPEVRTPSASTAV